MTAFKTKIIICAVWAVCAAAFFCSQSFWSASGQRKVGWQNLDAKPSSEMIDYFDASIQKRFLTEPSFGIRRIEPDYPTNPHFEFFIPKTDEEKKSLADFEKEGWKVYIYLFGRRAAPRVVDGKKKDAFDIKYRINQPVAVTKDLRSAYLPKGENLLDDVKDAFIAFQTPNSAGENNYEFRVGNWFYVARPVRAANESCLKCHTDYVITEKLKDNKFKFRPRRIGDANGVLVYGFSKDEPDTFGK